MKKLYGFDSRLSKDKEYLKTNELNHKMNIPAKYKRSKAISSNLTELLCSSYDKIIKYSFKNLALICIWQVQRSNGTPVLKLISQTSQK